MTWESYCLVAVVLYVVVVINTIHDSTVGQRPTGSPYSYIGLALLVIVWPLLIVGHSIKQLVAIWQWAKHDG